MKLKSALAALAILTVAALPAFAAPKWFTDLDEAKAVAAKENKPLLVDFTGSDWCGFCIKLHAEVFDKPEFEEFAKGYVLVELDFPNKKPQPPEEKAKNKAAQAKFGVTGFPTVLLLDAKTGEAYGRQGGYGPGTGPKAYLAKLSAFKNTEEGRAALGAEAKKSAEVSAKRSAASAKIRAAVEAKDFAAASAAYDEMYGEVSGRSKAILNMNKVSISMRIDPKDTARALKLIDEALVDAASDEALVTNIKSFRTKIAAGENPFAPRAVAPKAAAPKAEGKPAVEAKKIEKGA
jgi:thiol-disulfide isomerase/thioredoxin